MAYEQGTGGSSGYYANPINTQEQNNNDDDWIYPEGKDAESFYQSLIDNPVNYYGDTPQEIEAEPIEEEPKYDYSDYMQYSTTPEETET